MLEIHELLDRFQLLYPANNKLSDLRRSYVDQDLSSIFRLMPAVISGETEDLRKAVLEKIYTVYFVWQMTKNCESWFSKTMYGNCGPC
jgi:hypothetical protein